MKKSVFLMALIVPAFIGCRQSEAGANASDNAQASERKPVETVAETHNKPEDFVPKGYVVFEKNSGDLNKDGLDDCILIIKGTDKKKFVQHEYRGELDRNRRGIIVLFNKNKQYELAVKNYDCFSSENEEGGVYFPPELDIYAEKGNLYVHYAHGRYGYWTYTFRYKYPDFDLIGYDSSDNMGPMTLSETSINFLTKKKLERVNVNRDGEEDGDEIFKDTWSKIKNTESYKLSKIKDFDEFDLSEL
ncbi:hypothetical protein [Flavobacterium wongokense]|uniref:hypothetical protein n=1 Tax=Flavobacterium wongokense TaxID=2910674 RepID=UPI001F1D272F|nr:hypothetical protein [Flavobacterium sp. WG47]MCF6133283.1 hypothetical protein [Flavobacterium sp. WG47]